jgi:hypothetical protein
LEEHLQAGAALKLATSNPKILILVKASGPEQLPLLPTIVDLTSTALPILASAVSVPPPLIGAVGVAGAAVSVILDDSIVNIAVQTLVVGLALPVAGASLPGAAILGQLK